MDIWTDLPYLVVVASCEGIKCRRTKGQRSLRTPVILDHTANENVWALRDFRYAGDSTGLRRVVAKRRKLGELSGAVY